MESRDLRGWIHQAEELGELKKIDGADGMSRSVR